MARTKQTKRYDGSDNKKRKMLGLNEVIYEPRSGFIVVTRYNYLQKPNYDGYAWLANATQCPGIFTPLNLKLMLHRRRTDVNAVNTVINEFSPKDTPGVDELFGALQEYRFIGGKSHDIDFHCMQKKDIKNEDGLLMIEKHTPSYTVFDMNVTYNVAKERWDALPMWYGLIRVKLCHIVLDVELDHYVPFFRLEGDDTSERKTYYVTSGLPEAKVIVTNDMFHLLYSEIGQKALLNQLSLSFSDENFQIYFPRNKTGELLDVVVYPKYYKMFPPSFTLDQVEGGIVPYKISPDGAVSDSQTFVCELVDVNDKGRVWEIDFEIKD
jgi:hypothetical protein